MKNCLVIIDGGTTNTSFRLIEDDKLIAESKRRVGATDAKSKNTVLKEIVKSEIENLQKKYDCKINDVYASGMITSATGLKEIPHIPSPVTLKNLADNVQTHILDSMPEIRFHFVPGIRAEAGDGTGIDLIRGEETELFGAADSGDEEKDLLFIHFGSHNKIIRMVKNSIQAAETTLSGELLWAICSDTILKSSTPDLIGNDYILDAESMAKGFTDAQKHGFSRTLFLGRIAQVVQGKSPDQVLSAIFGALTYLDYQAFSPMLTKGADKLVLYGRDTFIQAFYACLPLMSLDEKLTSNIECISFEESQRLSLKGILRLIKN